MNSLEIIDKKDILKRKAEEIVNKAKAEERELNEGEQAEFEAINSEINQLNEELRRIKEENEKENKKETRNINMENKKFSLLSAINTIVNNRNLSEDEMEVVNRGIAEMRKSGQSYSGQIVMPVENRGVNATTATAGKEAVGEDMLDILPVLRDNSILGEMTWLTGLVGDVTIPTYTGSTAKWEGETTNDTTDAAGTFGEVKLSPKRLTATLAISKQFLIQDSAKAEELLRKDIVEAIQSKLQESILGSGDGTTGVKGLFHGVTADTATVKYSDIANLEATVEGSNIEGEKYIVSPTAKATLRTTGKDTGSGMFIMANGEIDGKPVLSTNAIAGKGVLYGNFNEYMVAQWGAIDLTVDPYSLASAGQVKLVVNAYFDAKPRRANAIVAKILK